jgi:hypothetical protein
MTDISLANLKITIKNFIKKILLLKKISQKDVIGDCIVGDGIK